MHIAGARGFVCSSLCCLRILTSDDNFASGGAHSSRSKPERFRVSWHLAFTRFPSSLQAGEAMGASQSIPADDAGHDAPEGAAGLAVSPTMALSAD